MKRELKTGKNVCIGGRTYKGFVPESVIKAHGLKDDLFISVKPKTHAEAKAKKEAEAKQS